MPRRAKEPRKREERFNMHLPAALRETYRRAAQRDGQSSIAAMIRRAVDDYIRTRKLDVD